MPCCLIPLDAISVAPLGSRRVHPLRAHEPAVWVLDPRWPGDDAVLPLIGRWTIFGRHAGWLGEVQAAAALL